MPRTSRISAVIGTAGHIDHGKTSLVKALTGMDTDTLKEERRRGVSIDLGFAYMDIKGVSCEGVAEATTRVAIIDVPGHARFLRNMLAGITGIDMVLFAIAADDGIMPQTMEHLDIVRLLGVERGVFVITKKDLVGKDRLDTVEARIRGLVKGTPLENSPVLSVSAVTGEGMDELRCLVKEKVVAFRCQPARGFFRLPVDRSFPVKGFGTVVTGTVAGGSIRKGDEVICFPGVVKARVRGLQSLYLDVDEVREGERAAVNLSGVSHNDIKRGFMLLSPELAHYAEYAALEEDVRVDCLFEFLPEGGPLRGPVKSGAILKLHHFTSETLAKVRFTGRKEVLPGERVSGSLTLRTPLLMLKGDRFILRNPSLDSTIAGGAVLLPHLSRASAHISERIKPGPDGGYGAWLERGVEGVGLKEEMLKLLPEGALLAALEMHTLPIILNIREDELRDSFSEAGPLHDPFTIVGAYAMNRRALGMLKRRITEIAADIHRLNPEKAWIKDPEILEGLKGEVPDGLGMRAASSILKGVLDEMAWEAGMERSPGAIRLLNHAPSGGTGDGATMALKDLFSRAGFSSVNMDDLGKLPFSADEVQRALRLEMENGSVVRLKENSFISRESLDIARSRLIEHMKASGFIKASEMRDILGCGRKLAIEILEHFDKERLTLRKGDLRVLRDLCLGLK